MFNLQKIKNKVAQITSTEKYLRENTLTMPSKDDSISEKKLPHWTGDTMTVTESQMSDSGQRIEKDDALVIEKAFAESKSYYPHRSDATWLTVPPMQALVEKMRQNRLASDWKEDKDDTHWTVSYDDQKQLGQLPIWPMIAEQHDKIVLNNDPRRFENLKSLPTETSVQENMKNLNKSHEIKPLVGGITTADVNKVAYRIKTGQSIDYDTAIVAILREADRDQRDLTEVEQKAIVELKTARTKSMITTCNE